MAGPFGPKTSDKIADEVVHHYTQWHDQNQVHPLKSKNPDQHKLHMHFVHRFVKHLVNTPVERQAVVPTAVAQQRKQRSGTQIKLLGRGVAARTAVDLAKEHPELHGVRAGAVKTADQATLTPRQLTNLRFRQQQRGANTKAATGATQGLTKFLADHSHRLHSAIAKHSEFADRAESLQAFVRFVQESAQACYSVAISSQELRQVCEDVHHNKAHAAAHLAAHWKKNGGANDTEADYLHALLHTAMLNPNPAGGDSVNQEYIRRHVAPNTSPSFPSRTWNKFKAFAARDPQGVAAILDLHQADTPVAQAEWRLQRTQLNFEAVLTRQPTALAAKPGKLAPPAQVVTPAATRHTLPEQPVPPPNNTHHSTPTHRPQLSGQRGGLHRTALPA